MKSYEGDDENGVADGSMQLRVDVPYGGSLDYLPNALVHLRYQFMTEMWHESQTKHGRSQDKRT